MLIYLQSLNGASLVEEGFCDFVTVERVADTTTVSVSFVLLVSKLRDLSILCLGPGSSMKRVEMSNSMSDPMKFEKHPCLWCEGLLSKICKLELSEILELPKFQDIGFPSDVNFFEKLLGLVSTRLKPSRFATENLLPR